MLKTFCLSCLFFIPVIVISQIEQDLIRECFDLVRGEYAGEKALATTAYVSEFWRLPGNPGFDSSIYRVEHILQAAGFKEEQPGEVSTLSYPLEKRPTRRPAWEPISASLQIVGEKENLLDFATNQPEQHQNSIPFTSIPFNSNLKSWGINLSYQAKEKLLEQLKKGMLKVKVNIETKFHSSPELTLIAEIRGKTKPEERFVFSAHVQEPGANDNASGVGALAEMARVAAKLTQEGKVSPERTITFLWGDEIRATRRFIQEDKKRIKGIRWGISLDMVGEDTEKTGGTFLIEKMPDPSAIWTCGEDKHTEWGATKVAKADLNPHFFNDFILHICLEQAKGISWIVNTNPYEGGSDHQPFLDAKKPGLLLWHFTDVFYHTDADRIDKVSSESLYNVGVSALVSALTLSSGNQQLARDLLKVLANAAKERLRKEFILSQSAIKEGGESTFERDILWTWAIWYVNAIQTLEEIPVKGSDEKLIMEIDQIADQIEELALRYMVELGK